MFGLDVKILLVGALVASLGSGYGLWQRSKALSAKQELLAVEQERDALGLALVNERAALVIANAERARFQAQALEYDQLREQILTGGEDADIPDWLADYLGRLLGD